jgi:hypothetical protein
MMNFECQILNFENRVTSSGVLFEIQNSKFKIASEGGA